MLRKSWNDDKIKLGQNVKSIISWKGDITMAKKLTEKSLEKKLYNMNTEELIQMIMNLYKSNKSVEQSINLQIIGDAYGNDLLEKYKKRLYKIFNPSDIVRMGFSIDNAQNVLSEFADVCVNDKGRWYGDLALYFSECATDFTMSFGDIDEDFYDILGDAYHDAVVAASDNEELYKLWKDRLESILHDFAGFGWGMDDYISEEYYSIPWVQEDNE